VHRVLVANRGEIAARVVRACFDEGLESVVATSAADRDSLPALLADRAVVIGPAHAGQSYLSVDRMLAAAQIASCDALHPGYGFLSERPELAAACEENGVVFVGPSADVMRRSGDKMMARNLAREIGIPTGVGSESIETADDAVTQADLVGYPVMLKAAAGGGGRGMAILPGPEELRRRFPTSRAEAEQAFGDGRLYVERYVARARHVEVQIVGDAHGTVVHLGERDCSCQRRHQKLIEEAPAPGLSVELVDRLRDSAVRLGKALGYTGAGTVEFLVDVETNSFVFLEVNARIQVEHPVTEAVTGIDIVREQLRVAAGKPLSFAQADVEIRGHAIECRINAEDPAAGFVPSPGVVTRWLPPHGAGVRVDTHIREGAEIPPYYDSMVAKVITHADDREGALSLMGRALGRFRIEGVTTTVPLHRAVVADDRFRREPVTTRWVEEEFLPSWEQSA
jgi:acetyl-CoA carboxylase biotin carboxylase subunit